VAISCGCLLMAECFVYVLKSKRTHKRYVGITNNLGRRLKEHNGGNCRSTKAGAPWKLIYKEIFDSHEEARKREKFFKSGQGREWLRSTLGK